MIDRDCLFLAELPGLSNLMAQRSNQVRLQYLDIEGQPRYLGYWVSGLHLCEGLFLHRGLGHSYIIQRKSCLWKGDG